MQLVLLAVLTSLCSVSQQPAQTASLHGVVRDDKGRPIAQAVIVLQKKSSRDTFTVQTDSQGNYRFVNLTDGIYGLSTTKDGFVASYIEAVSLNLPESRTIDLTLKPAPAGTAAGDSTPQFFDPPQFTVAGVTDTTNLGGHGSDTLVRTRDSLAKDTASLADSSANTSSNSAHEQSLRDAALRQPTDFRSNHLLGEFLLDTGRPHEAIAYLDRAANADPASYENAYALAVANAKAGNYLVAREQCQKILTTHDQAPVHHLLGDVEEKLGNSLDAVHHYQRAAELEPTEAHLFDWGAELLLHHAPEPALEVFSQGNRRFPSSERTLLALGAASFARGDYDGAIRRISQASNLNPTEPTPYLFLGKIEESQTVPTREMVETLHRFLTLQPQNADANYYYALGLWKLRKSAPEKQSPAEVESLLRRAIQIDPNHGRAALQLGIIHSDQGAYNEAVSDLHKALAADPQLEEAHYRLAQVYRQLRQPEKASDELRLYTELTKQSAQQQDRERHEIKQFVYTLRDQPSTQ